MHGFNATGLNGAEAFLAAFAVLGAMIAASAIIFAQLPKNAGDVIARRQVIVRDEAQPASMPAEITGPVAT